MLTMKKNALTSTYIVLILGIILIIVSLFIINVVKKYQEKSFETEYKNEVQKISNMVDNLTLAENQDSFFYTTMYTEIRPSNYAQTSGYFLEKYIGINRVCGNSDYECFSSNYKDEKKKPYIPDLEGACAVLKNGISICLKPQINEEPIQGIMDINGKFGPNTLGKDLRTFELDKRTKPVEEVVEQDEVIIID